MNRFIFFDFLICLTFQPLCFANSFNTLTNVSKEKPLNIENRELNDIKTSVVCNKTWIGVNFTFGEPFFGVIYTNQIFSVSASQCRSYGNGSAVVHFHTNSHECGVRSIDNQSIYNEYELVLYVQNDRNIQQASDQKIEVKCAPQEVLLSGVVANRNPNTSKFNGKSLFGGSYIQVNRMLSHNFTLKDISDSLECRMDVMKGRIPFLKPIDGFVDLGQDVTVMIKIKEIEGIDSMISRCYAHEGSHVVKQELTNSDGCSIDTNILPNFQLMPNPPSDSKVYFTTFPAFKFPDKTNLNLQCTVIICNTTCPQIECDNTRDNTRGLSPALHRIKRLSNHRNAKRAIIIERKLMAMKANHNNNDSSDSLLSDIGVSNPMSVINGPNIDNESHKTFRNISLIDRLYINELNERCLTSGVILTSGLLMTIALLGSLTIACCCCALKTQQINQKLLNKECVIESKKPFTYEIQREDNQNISLTAMQDIII